MPVIRAKREISRNALPGVRLTASETATSTGAGAELAKAHVGDAMAQTGSLVARIGLSQMDRIAQERRDYADQVFAISADTQLSKVKTNLLLNQENGALNRMGKDALGIPEEVNAAFEKASGELEATAKTPRQRAMLLKIKAQHGQDISLKTERHVFEQMREYGVNEINASIEANVNEAIIDGLDPDTAGVPIGKALAAIDLLGPKVGWGPQKIAEVKLKTTTAAIDGILTRLITNGQDKKATEWFNEQKAQGNIAGTALERMEKKVRAATTDGEAERAADLIWAKLGPKDDDDAVSLDAMSTEAREMFADDDDVRKATLAALRDRREEALASRKSRQDERDGVIWGSIFKGANLRDVKQMPEFVNAPGEVQQKIGEYFRREAEHRESLAASRESRAAAAENRALSAEARKERDLEMKGWATYLDFKADPAKLRDATPADILRKLPELGRAHVNRLLEDREQLSKDEATFRAAVIDRDLFNEVMQDAGVPGVYASPARRTPEQRADLGKLLSTIEEAIGRKQVAAGRKLTREETEKIARETVDAKVLVKDNWFSDDERFPALVRFSDVPDAQRSRILAHFAAMKVPNPTEQQVVDAYVEMLPKVKK